MPRSRIPSVVGGIPQPEAPSDNVQSLGSGAPHSTLCVTTPTLAPVILQQPKAAEPEAYLLWPVPDLARPEWPQAQRHPQLLR